MVPAEPCRHAHPCPALPAEYWPEPQRGICEAYRVLKPGGVACMIGGCQAGGSGAGCRAAGVCQVTTDRLGVKPRPAGCLAALA